MPLRFAIVRHVSLRALPAVSELHACEASPASRCTPRTTANKENEKLRKTRCCAICTYCLVLTRTHKVTLDYLYNICLPLGESCSSSKGPAQAWWKCSHTDCTLYWLMDRPQQALTDLRFGFFFFVSAIGIIFSA